MTTVQFYTEGSRILGFQVEGHSGLAHEGMDILCAAVTSTVRFVECAVNDVLGLEAAVKVREEDAAISLKLPGGLSPELEHTCQTILAAMMLYLLQLTEEYPENIIVLEV
jgi:uncharacterized protein YsxB (DUF464 family)